MATTPKPKRIARFGVFEADLQAGELRKGGLRIKLQDQPFQILAMLLERPGEVVTREELALGSLEVKSRCIESLSDLAQIRSHHAGHGGETDDWDSRMGLGAGSGSRNRG